MTAIGIARRGKEILRSRFSRVISEVTQPLVTSLKKLNSTSAKRM